MTSWRPSDRPRSEPAPGEVRWDMRLGTGGKVVLIGAATVVVLAGLRAAAFLLLPLLMAGFLTVLNLPVVRWLVAQRVPRLAAIMLAVLLNLAVFAALGGAVGGSLSEFTSRVPTYQARLAEAGDEFKAVLEGYGLVTDADRFGEAASAVQVMDWVATLFQSLAELVSQTLIVLLLVLFMLLEAANWRIKLAYLVGRPTEDLPRFRSASREIQLYLLVKTAICLLTGVLYGATAAAMGVDFPILWGLLAFLLTYVPTIGPFLAVVPPVAMALIQHGLWPAAGVFAVLMVINFVFGNVVEPRVMGRALGLSPLVVLISMVFWGWLWGPVGALLAVPLTMILKIIFANTSDLRWAAVLLGSEEWFEQRRKTWTDPVQDELRRTYPPPDLGTVVNLPTVEELLEDDPPVGTVDSTRPGF